MEGGPDLIGRAVVDAGQLRVEGALAPTAAAHRADARTPVSVREEASRVHGEEGQTGE